MIEKNLKYKPIIGLEIHIELKTESKMFCSCKADYFSQEPNTQICPVCLGLPGALPVPNKKAIEWCIKLGLALGCTVNKESYFERKNYFYPDLPKGYQISQYAKPFCTSGTLILSNGKTVRINRVHMEEDTGKLTHEGDATLIDYNRSSVPLVEVVSEPDMETVEEAKDYCEKIQKLVRALGISDADMEKGTMRLEPTINLKVEKDGKTFYTPLVELKNINSFRFVKNALEYEIERQLEEFENTGVEKDRGNKTTRGYNEDKDETYLQRSKEEANDYRYFPEPDIPPFEFSDDYIDKIKSDIPELPENRLVRFQTAYGLSLDYAKILTENKTLADYFEKALEEAKGKNVDTKIIANWLVNKKLEIDDLLPADFIKQVIEINQYPEISEEELEKLAEETISQNPKAVADYKNGKNQALMFLVGQLLRQNHGKISAEKAKVLILEKIK